MIKLTSLNIFGQRNDILDLQKEFDKTLDNISAASEDFQRIPCKRMKTALIT